MRVSRSPWGLGCKSTRKSAALNRSTNPPSVAALFLGPKTSVLNSSQIFMSVKHSIYRRELFWLCRKAETIAMDSSRLALLFFLVSIQLSALTSVQSETLLRLCSTQSNFTMNSTYGNNLKHLFSTITSNTQIDYGFYNVSYGQNSDKVSAIGLCRGDVKPDICRSCITNATNEFTEYCPNQKAAIVWYDECMLRYSNRSIFGKMQFQPALLMANVNNVSNVNQFNQVLATLLDDLRIQAASGDSLRKFATGNATVSNSQAIYALAQCTPDLSQVECNNCLSNATESLPPYRLGARILTPSCTVRYENYTFYGPLVDMPPPTISPASPPVDVPPPTSLVTPAPPAQQPNLATRKGNTNCRFQFLAPMISFAILCILKSL